MATANEKFNASLTSHRSFDPPRLSPTILRSSPTPSGNPNSVPGAGDPLVCYPEPEDRGAFPGRLLETRSTPVREEAAVQRRPFLQTAAVSVLMGHLRAEAADRRVPVIDTHLHCFAGQGRSPVPLPPQGPYQPAQPATPEHLLKCMDEAGVDHAIVVHPEPYQDDHRYLEYCLEVGGES